MERLPIVTTLLLVCVMVIATGCSHGEPPKSAAAPSASVAGNVDTDRLLHAEREPGQWLTAGGDWRGSHFSRLAAINATNVDTLGFAWAFDTNTSRGLEATPAVVDGTMFTSGVAGRVYALDAASGALKWSFEPPVDLQVTRGTCCDQVNRGVAVWRGKVYVATLDGWLYALDARSGAVAWKADTFTDRKRGYSSTGAPQIAGNVVVIGNAGGEFDARGYITAYDLATGAQRWRFYTVPGDPSKPFENPELAAAAKTWDRASAWTYGGGGPVWDGMAYDPQLDLLYVGTGNAETYPQKTRSPAGGDNLFTCSILAIHPATGRLAWHYQETPGDQWDYDATAPMVLADRELNGVQRKLLLHAPKNGLFYVIDRTDGSLVSAAKFVPVNWASGVDSKSGRPSVDRAAADYSAGPKLIFPSVVGAHSWNPMAYSPQTGLVYLPTLEGGNILSDMSGQAEYRPTLFNAGVGLELSGQMHAYLQAWDPIAQRQVWKTHATNWWDHAGVLATSGGLVFQGSDSGVLNVFDAASGKLLKSIETGSSIIAAPMTYEVDGVSYVAVMSAWGGGGWGFAHPESAAFRYGNAGRILAFKLGGGAVPIPAPLPPIAPIPEPPPQKADKAVIARGGMLFGSNCAICHSNQPRAGAPDLRRMSAQTHASFNGIVLGGLLKGGGMPGWGDVLKPEDADAIHAFLIDLARQGYEKEHAALKAGRKLGDEGAVIKGY